MMNMRQLFTVTLTLLGSVTSAQDPYFPPTTGTTWETVEPSSLGWCEDQLPPLLQYLENNGTKAFIVLKDGRIVIEEYFGTFTGDSVWYWASAGKSLTAFLVGMAQEDGLLDIDQPSSTYLGTGWTNCTPAQELAITVRHQLTMTTGLDDGVPDVDCTDPTCLHTWPIRHTLELPQWPYTKWMALLRCYGWKLNNFHRPTEHSDRITGLTFRLDTTISSATAQLRVSGSWHEHETNGASIWCQAFLLLTTPSQTLNNSYGYLWWLNGQSSYMLPGLQVEIPGSILPNEPADAYNALGKNGQFINVVPSQGIVLVRMGNAPDATPVPYVFNDDIWEYLNAVICTSTTVGDAIVSQQRPLLYPDPTNGIFTINNMGNRTVRNVVLIGTDGRTHPGILRITASISVTADEFIAL